jgi:hypothetical protein
LLRRRATGTPDQMAEKLGVSRSTWFEYLRVLREDLSCPIEYDSERETYYYKEKGRFVCGFKTDSTNTEHEQKEKWEKNHTLNASFHGLFLNDFFVSPVASDWCAVFSQYV